jgi:hypothetical protein
MKTKFANIYLDTTGFAYDPATWTWKLPSWYKPEDGMTENLQPGVVIEFDYDDTKTKDEVNLLLENRDKSVRIACESAEIFKSSKDYMIYKMFCELMNSRSHLLRRENSIQPALFYNATDENSGVKQYLSIKNIVMNLEWFADSVVDCIATLKQYLKTNTDMEEYKKLLVNIADKLKYIYNERILPYAFTKINFFEWNIFNFIVPHDQFIGRWVNGGVRQPSTDDELREACEKLFGDFHRDELLKKIYFDFYDLWFDDIVDYNWRGHVGIGWKPLVRKACEIFKQEEYKSYFWWERIEAAQIKEKFGTLRIYVDCPSDWYFRDVIEGNTSGIEDETIEQAMYQLENESEEICEDCGVTRDEDPTVETKANSEYGWIRTLCANCRKKIS